MTQEKKRSLRNLLINPKMQFNLIGTAMLICVLCQGFLLLFQMYSFVGVQDNLMKSLDDVKACHTLLGDLEITLYQSVILSFILSVVCSVGVLTLLTHRIAGPIFKMTRFLEEVADDPSKDGPVQFRKNDYFQELANAYNRRFDGKK